MWCKRPYYYDQRAIGRVVEVNESEWFNKLTKPHYLQFFNRVFSFFLLLLLFLLYLDFFSAIHFNDTQNALSMCADVYVTEHTRPSSICCYCTQSLNIFLLFSCYFLFVLWRFSISYKLTVIRFILSILKTIIYTVSIFNANEFQLCEFYHGK